MERSHRCRGVQCEERKDGTVGVAEGEHTLNESVHGNRNGSFSDDTGQGGAEEKNNRSGEEGTWKEHGCEDRASLEQPDAADDAMCTWYSSQRGAHGIIVRERKDGTVGVAEGEHMLIAKVHGNRDGCISNGKTMSSH